MKELEQMRIPYQGRIPGAVQMCFHSVPLIGNVPRSLQNQPRYNYLSEILTQIEERFCSEP